MLTWTILQHFCLIIFKPVIYSKGLTINMSVFSVSQNSSIWKKHFICRRQCRHHNLISFYLSLFLLLQFSFFIRVLITFLLNNIIIFLIWIILPFFIAFTISIIPISIFFLHFCFFFLHNIFSFLRDFFIINNNFYFLIINAKWIRV